MFHAVRQHCPVKNVTDENEHEHTVYSKELSDKECVYNGQMPIKEHGIQCIQGEYENSIRLRGPRAAFRRARLSRAFTWRAG